MTAQALRARPRSLWLSLAAPFVAMAAPGCSADGGTAAGELERCEEGVHRACYAEMSRDDATITCRTGSQACVGGVWGPCEGGYVSSYPLPDPSLLRPQGPLPDALSDPDGNGGASGDDIRCSDKPPTGLCAPWCRVHDGDGPLTPNTGAGGGSGSDWSACDPASAAGACDIPGITSTPPVTGLCGGELCEPNSGGLPRGCHWCVDLICDHYDASCCDTDWDQPCQELVYTKCGGYTSPPVRTICDYGVYSGGNLTFMQPNNTAGRMGPVLTEGNFTIGNDSKVYSVTALGDINIAARVDVEGNLNAGGNLRVNGDNVDVHGNAWAASDFFSGFSNASQALWLDGRISYTTWSGGSMYCPIGSGATCTTGVPPAPALTVPVMPPAETVTPSANAADDRTAPDNGWPSGASISIPPGSYRNLQDGNGGPRVILTDPDFSDPAVYHFASIDLNSNGGIVIPCGPIVDGRCTAQVDIRATGDMKFGDEFTFLSSDSAHPITILDATRIQLYTDGNISFGNGAEIFATLRAPTGNVSFGNINGGEAGGLLWAGGAVSLGAGAIFNSLSISDACEARYGVSGSLDVSTCPIDDLKPGARAPIQTPCYSGEDCQANYRCADAASNIPEPPPSPAVAHAQLTGRPWCDHSKCLTGSYLNATCDPCVEMICNTTEGAGCCSSSGTGWTADCVALVKTVCDADCPASNSYGTPSVACTHNPCATGGPLTNNCDDPTVDPSLTDCVAKVCASPGMADCCLSTWDAYCVQEAAIVCQGATRPIPEIAANLCDFAIVATTNLSINTPQPLDGGIYNGGGNVSVTNNTTFTGQIFADGNVNTGNAAVTGQIRATGTHTMGGSGTVTPAPIVNTTPLPPTGFLPLTVASNPVNDFASGCGVTPLSAPGAYGDVVMGTWGCATVNTIAAGDYYVDNFTLEGVAKLQLQLTLPTDRVRIFATGNVNFRQDSQVLDSNTGLPLVAADAHRFQVFALGNITVGSNMQLAAFLQAPNGQITTSNSSVLTGLAHGRSVYLDWNSRIDGTASVGATCKANLDAAFQGTNQVGGGPSTPIACTAPFPNNDYTLMTDINGEGTCVANAVDWIDTTIPPTLATPPFAAPTLPDLTGGIPCSDRIPVCNHGSDKAVGTITLGFWPDDTGGIYTRSPDPNWMVGYCEAAIDLQAGFCTSVDLSSIAATCVGLDPLVDLTTPHAVLVNWDSDPSAVDARLDEFSYLDNWTVFTPGEICEDICHPSHTCTGGPAPTAEVYTQRYQMGCADPAAIPEWVTLFWNATIDPSSAAEVRFEWRTADTLAGLAAATYKPVTLISTGVTMNATAAVPDCEPGVPACGGIVLNDVMTLDEQRQEFLELRITVEPNYATDPAGATVELEDWDVRFYCEDSQ